jgi:hypothetical protein
MKEAAVGCVKLRTRVQFVQCCQRQLLYSFNRSPFSRRQAAEEGHTALVELLLQHGACADARIPRDGFTAFMCAAQCSALLPLR